MSFANSDRSEGMDRRPMTTSAVSPRLMDARPGGWSLRTGAVQGFGGGYSSEREALFPNRPNTVQSPRGRTGASSKNVLRGVSTLVPHPPSAVPMPAMNGLSALESGATSQRLPWERTLTSPRAVPPASYARPSTRLEAVSLSEKLRTMLGEGGSRDKNDSAWHGVFLELVRQVYVHCNERGQLLDAVRVYLEGELKLARTQLAEQQRELLRLRKDASVLMGTSTTPSGRGGADASSSTQQQQQEEKRVQLEKRVEMLFEAGARLPLDGKISLVARLVECAHLARLRAWPAQSTLDGTPPPPPPPLRAGTARLTSARRSLSRPSPPRLRTSACSSSTRSSRRSRSSTSCRCSRRLWRASLPRTALGS